MRSILLMLVGAIALSFPRRFESGDLYVANIRSNEVSVFDGQTGTLKRVLVPAASGVLKGPTGIAFGPDGNLYVASSQSNQIFRYNPDTGESLGAFVEEDGLTMPFSLIFGPDGDLYVSSGRDNVVRHYNGRTGEFVSIAAADTALKQPIGLAFGPDGMLYVVNSAHANIMRFDPRTGRGATFASDSMRFPSDLTFGPDGALYVSNAARRNVVRFDAESGAFRDVFARLPERAAPVGLAFRKDGRLFVGDFASDRLFIVEPGGGDAMLVSSEGLGGPENIAIRP